MRLEQVSDILPPRALGEEPPVVMIVIRMQEPSVKVLFILCGHVSGCHTMGCGGESLQVCAGVTDT